VTSEKLGGAPKECSALRTGSQEMVMCFVIRILDQKDGRELAMPRNCNPFSNAKCCQDKAEIWH